MQSLKWRVGHDPNSKNEQRCTNYLHTKNLLGSDRECVAPQIYARSPEELGVCFLALPGEFENIKGPGDSQFSRVCTRENVELLFHLWLKTTELNPKRDAFRPAHLIYSRFSLHLSQWLAIEEFILSSETILFLIDDDFELDSTFLKKASEIICSLPSDWEIFSFDKNPNQYSTYNPALRVGDTAFCVNFQSWAGTCMIFTKTGAKKYLWDCFFGVRRFAPGNSNIDNNIDLRVANLEITGDFDRPMYSYRLDFSPNRRLKSYCFIPEAESPVRSSRLPSTIQPEN